MLSQPPTGECAHDERNAENGERNRGKAERAEDAGAARREQYRVNRSVRSDDLRREPRWPRYAPAAVKLGVLSGLSFKLYTADRTAGALNLFGFQPGVWDTDAETTGAVLAAHAAAAILASRQGEQLQTALSTRDRIGQAKGIIMERYGVDDVRAFDMLRAISQESQIKLADVAQRVIDTRDNT